MQTSIRRNFQKEMKIHMGSGFRKPLQKEDLMKLPPGSQVHVNTWVIGGTGGVIYPDAPVLVVGIKEDDFVFIYIDENGVGKQGRLDLKYYSHTWDATAKDGFLVKTAEGCLWAMPSEEGNGVFINRLTESGRAEGYLAQTMYCSKSASLWSNSLDNKENDIEAKRVPLDRVKPKPSVKAPVSREDVVAAPDDFRVTAGFTTYIMEGGELKSRVFHAKGRSKQ